MLPRLELGFRLQTLRKLRRAEATAHARGRAIFYTPRYFICRAAPPRAQCGLTTAGVYAVRMLYGALALGAVCVLFGFVGQVCVCCDVCPSCHVLSFRCRWRCRPVSLCLRVLFLIQFIRDGEVGSEART